MPACQVDTQLTLHRADEMDMGKLSQHLFDKREVGQIILYIKDCPRLRARSGWKRDR